MTKKKPYKNRMPNLLPPVVPPTPRTAPDARAEREDQPEDQAQDQPEDQAEVTDDRPDTEPDTEPDIMREAAPTDEPPTDEPPVTVPPTDEASTRVAASQATASQVAASQVPPTDERPRRRLLSAPVLLVAGVLVVLALLTAGVVTFLTGSDRDDEPAGSAAKAPGRAWPPAGASRTSSRVRPNGTVVVTHWIHAAAPTEQLDLRLPRVPVANGIGALDIRVVADDVQALGPGSITWSSATYAFDPATRIRVTYTLTGALERSRSVIGRALATTTALETSIEVDRDRRIIRSMAVLSLACADPREADTTAIPCGKQREEGRWSVRLTGDQVGDRVMAVVTVS